jgi:hypothetical protein
VIRDIPTRITNHAARITPADSSRQSSINLIQSEASMKKHVHKVAVLFGILLLLLTSGIAAAQSPSIQFKVTYNAGAYEVWMKPTSVS